MKKLGIFFLAAVCMSVLFTGSVWAKTETVTIALGSEPTTLDPQIREDGGERAVNDNIYDTVLTRTPEGELIPSLAAEMPKLVATDTWEVTLRPGIRFHNGEPLNAEALAYSIRRVIDPEFNSEQISFFSTIKDARATGDLTVHVVTNGPDPILPSRLYLPKIPWVRALTGLCPGSGDSTSTWCAMTTTGASPPRSNRSDTGLSKSPVHAWPGSWPVSST